MCGLKPRIGLPVLSLLTSHPAWVCGLKLYSVHLEINITQSHPAWVCGLKLVSQDILLLTIVTPCVGVWIETVMYDETPDGDLSHPAWVCGLKLGGIIAAGASLGHTLRGCVD